MISNKWCWFLLEQKTQILIAAEEGVKKVAEVSGIMKSMMIISKNEKKSL